MMVRSVLSMKIIRGPRCFFFFSEVGTVFQRTKTLGTLNGMSTKPRGVHVYRGGKWSEVSTVDLLPGDLISVRVAKTAETKEKEAAAEKADKAAADKEGKDGKKPDGADGGAVAVVDGGGPKPPQKKRRPPPGSDAVPCDCVLLRGAAVVNEATLTGESVPQMKDALRCSADETAERERALDINGRDRVHTLFSGARHRLVLATEGIFFDGYSQLFSGELRAAR